MHGRESLLSQGGDGIVYVSIGGHYECTLHTADPTPGRGCKVHSGEGDSKCRDSAGTWVDGKQERTGGERGGLRTW